MGTHFDIRPLQGVGAVEFGMTSAEVSAILDAPLEVSTTSRGEREERREGLTVRYDGAGVVEYISALGIQHYLHSLTINIWLNPFPISRN